MLRTSREAEIVTPLWHDSSPLYRQLLERVIAGILDGDFTEGVALPSIRCLAGELHINPLTVTKAYQTLVDEGLVEKHRGLGFFVKPETRNQLRTRERERFLQNEWPALAERLRRLGLDLATMHHLLP